MDRNLDERLRKPRRAKGTPFAQTRNYLTLGVFAISAVTLYLFEKLPVIQRLKRDLLTTNKFQTPPEIKEHIASMNIALNQPELNYIIKKYQEKKIAESLQYEEEPKEQPWYSVFYQSLYIPKVPSKTETISRYFTKLDRNEDKHNQSIYQDVVSEVGEKLNTQLNNSDISDGDFVSPKPVKKLARIFSEVKEANKYATRSKSFRASKKVLINEEKKLMHVAKTADVNMEHLQLAMAMSKSMEPDLSLVNENENVYPSTQEIAENARQSLMAFRYNPHRPKSQKVVLGEGVTKLTTARKKSKFRYVKPKLFTTTQEDRDRKIQEKIAQIIAYPFDANCSSGPLEEIVHSCTLQDLVNVDKKLYRKSIQHSTNINDYYVDVLQLDKSQATCGCLLKKWEVIPGRDASPEKQQKRNELYIPEDIGTTISDENYHVPHQELKKKENNDKIINITPKNAKKQSSVKHVLRGNIDGEKNIEESCSKVAMGNNATLLTEEKLQVGTISEVETIKNTSSSFDDNSDRASASGTFATAQSSFFSSVSQLSRHTFRSTSPDLFASSDEEMIDDVFGHAKSATSNIPPEEKYSNENQPSNAGGQDKDSFKKYASASLNSNMNAQRENYKQEEHSRNLKKNENNKDTISYEVHKLIGLTPKRPKFKEFASASQWSKIKVNDSNATLENLNESNQSFEINDNGICTYESFCDYEENNLDDSVQTASPNIIDDTMHDQDNINESKTTENVNSLPIVEDIPEGNNDIDASNCGNDIDDCEHEALSSVNEKTYISSVSELPTPNQTCNRSYDDSAFLASGKSYKTMNVTHHIQALLNSETFAAECKSICVENYFASNTDVIVNNLVEKQNLNLKNCDSERTIPVAPIELQEINDEPENADLIDLSQDNSDCDDPCIDLKSELSNVVENYDNQDVSRVNSSQIPRNSSVQRNLSTNSLASTTSTTDSICISDEELNYSSMHATLNPNKEAIWRFEKLAYKNNKFAISESEDDDDFGKNVGNENEVEVSFDVTKMLRVLQERKAVENQLNADSEEDEELQEAIKLSLLETKIDEGRRLSQSDHNEIIEIDNKDESNEIGRSLNPKDDVTIDEDEFGDIFPVIRESFQFCPETNEKENESDNVQTRCSLQGFTNENVNIEDNNLIHIIEHGLNEEVKRNQRGNGEDASTSNKNDDMEFTLADCSEIASVSTEINENYHHLHDSRIEENDDLPINHSFPSFNYDHFDDYSIRTPEKVANQISNLKSPMASSRSSTENQPDEFDCLLTEKSVFTNMLTAIKPRRVQELITRNKTSVKHFEDTFARLLEQSEVLQNMDQIETNKATASCSNQNADPRLKMVQASKTSPIASKTTIQASRTPGTPADGIFVKSVDVTPMPVYENMTTPEIHAELDKIGVKRMKRRRGVEMLKHVYNSMHIQLEWQHGGDQDADDQTLSNKRRKKLNFNEIDLSGCDTVERKQYYLTPEEGEIEINSELAESEPLEDMIFERTQSKRIKSCALPFHIAWFNFLCVNREIWKNVLLYVPLQVEVLYAMFKELGFKYHIQDMITFFDKKCITIRIKRNN